ncbi:MAG: DUF885 domain-containing protein, partial [Sphingomonadaceae bacterium]|nr:DUF885 domain-containing protein [Sphingomonadaceae bacterium]
MSFEITRRDVLTGLAAGTILGIGGCATPAPTREQRCFANSALAAEADRLLLYLPETGTYNGADASLDGGPLARTIDNYSPAGEQALRAATAASRDRVASLECGDGREALRTSVVEAILTNAGRSAAIPYGRINPFSYVNHAPYLVSQISGPHIDSPAVMITQQSLRTPAAIDAWLEKLEGFETGFANVVEKIRADEAAGCRPPKALLQKTLPVLDSFLEGPVASHPLIEALRDRMAEAVIDKSARDAAMERATAALETKARPAYAALREQIAAMLPRGRDEAGIWAQPEGAALYAANIRALGDTTQPSDEIHHIGLAEVERITAEMETLLTAQGLTQGTVGERMLALADDPRFLFEDSDAGRQAVLDYVSGKVRDAEGMYDRLLPPQLIPSQPMLIRRVPVSTQDSAPGGYYDAPSLDGTRPGTYWINLRDMSAVA